ncbi:uncharacterized protein LOC133840415 [Drosophila sulfurigaster albostrigata]|uniref:uncharacterized protein LOC133840415 n=1 Tax=Drosophila sulfurigaster albostrigata TaxID=89887 RepID=UPI002D21E759|nr:uncharacterized protein LOC133840415 [Drosophila sulfurigaster albostrigata]
MNRKKIVGCLTLLLCGLQICNSFSYEKVGEGYYFIGIGQTDENIFDYFDARRSCWQNDGELVSVETAEEMMLLQIYVSSKGYPNGSIFSTSGHSYNSEYPFKWHALGESLTYKKWLAGDAPPLDCNLSLQLIDSELYMIRTWGYNKYYICEKTTFWDYTQACFRQSGTIIISMSIFFLLLFILTKLIMKIIMISHYRAQYHKLKASEKSNVDIA